MCCSLVYLHCVDCNHMLLSTLKHSIGFVPPNHRQLSLSIFDQLCDWRWFLLLGKNVKVHRPYSNNIIHTYRSYRFQIVHGCKRRGPSLSVSFNFFKIMYILYVVQILRLFHNPLLTILKEAGLKVSSHFCS